MKEIIFVRHAKSDWGNELLKDIDRPLSERGYSDAYAAAEWYLGNKPMPEFIISSTATRALNTALIFARKLEFDMEKFILEERIYESTVDHVLEMIREQPSFVSSMMLFGHNPAFTNICNELTEDTFFDNVPTSGIVSFNFEVNDWTNLELKKGKLNYYHFPKDFKNHD
jgi:phosphohistidine phosphatase